MGVQGLWQLLHPAGKPVSPSSLEGKVLAVDVSIWLHQTMKGMRDKDGNPLPNAHLQGLFSRVCKLLFYRIRPVFVFDGGVPALKKQTVAFRRERKENVEREKGHMNKKLLENLLQTHAVRGMTGERTDFPDQPSRRRAEPDIFELPPMPDLDEGSTDGMETTSLWEADADLLDEHRDVYQSLREDLQNLEEIDADSPEFQSLPPEIRHEILSEMKEQRRENALARIAIMPEDSKDFSDYQLKKLIKHSQLSGQIESVRKEMNKRVSVDITYALGDNYYGEMVEANRVVSEDAAHYVLIKGLTRKQQVAEAERCRERRLSREKRQLEQKPDKKDLTLNIETEKSTNEDDFGDQDEAEMEWDIRVRKRANRQILSDDDDDDDETNDESHRKRSRRERRGKSLVTRKGLRNMAKRGKGRSTVKRLSVLDEDEERVLTNAALEDSVSSQAVPHVEVLKLEKEDIPINNDEDLLGNSSPAPINTSPLSAERSDILGKTSPDSVDALRIPVNTCSVPGDTLSQPGNVFLGSQRTSSTVSASVEVKVEMVDESDTEESLKAAQDAFHGDKRGSQLSEDNDGRESGDGVQGTADTENMVENLLEEEQDARFMKTTTSPDPQAAEKDVSFTETQNRLLREEEDLNKAKEDKMAALLKSLEKRRHIVESAPAQTPGSTEDVSHQQQQELLLKQEEDLKKEKDSKMAALLQAVEKRSSLQSEAAPGSERSEIARDLPANEARKGGRRKKTREVNSGFLEDVVDLERRTVQRKLKSRLTKQAASSAETAATTSPSSSSKSQAVPALTVDYLEDVESMAELDEKGGKDRGSNTGNSDADNNMKTSVEDLPPQDSGHSTSTLKCSELFEEAGHRSTERKPTTDTNTDDLNHDSKQKKTKGEESQQHENSLEGLKVQRTDISQAPKTEASGRAEGDGSTKESKEPPEQHPSPVEEQEDSEDEGFIEITINPSNVPEEDLFPASIFATELPPGGTTFPNNTSDAQTKQIQPSSGSIDDDSIHEITESDLVGGEGNVDGNNTEQKVVGEWDASSSNHGKKGRADLPARGVDKDKEEGGGGGERRVSVESVQDEEVVNVSKGIDSLPDLYHLQRDLTNERKTLTLERGRQARLGKSVTEQISMEAQELLQLFGVPYVVGPMEAEAQCAHLEVVGLSQGTITDDSDAWLFGARNVYKNFFNNAKYVEFYSADAVCQRFGLDRRKLINLALLCGSDYTPGITGVGPVRAIEIMAEFPGDGLEGLRTFRNWWEDAKAGVLPRNQGPIKNKLRSLDLHDGFPSRHVVEAYLRPEVDESEEPFTWGLPDLDLLQQYAKKKFGWSKQKVDDVLEPMMKELTKKMSQGRIHSYFQPENFIPSKPVKSKRLQMALDKFQGGESSESESSESDSESESGSESEESEPDLPKRDKTIAPKAKQIQSGSTARGQGRGRGRGASRGKRGGKTGAPASPELGESIIQRANQILSGSTGSNPGRGSGRGKRGRKSGAPTKEDKVVGACAMKGFSSETRGGKSNAPRADNRHRGRRRGGGEERGRGKQESRRKATADLNISKNGRPEQRRENVVLKDEVSLSESSSSSDDDESKPKKSKTESVKSTAQLPLQQAGSVSKTQKSAAGKKRTNVPNVKQLKPTSTKSTTLKRKLQTDSTAKALVSREDSATFREAMGGDLDPSTMTLDDLGSDFSDS